jgi:hypothetical protein
MSTKISTLTLAPIANANVSEKYVTINTENVVKELEKRGFILREIKQAKTGKGRHVVRMRAKIEKTVNGETMFPEIVIMNSYDKKCGFSVEFGIFRLVCSNGLTVRVPGTESTGYKTRHIGHPAQIAADVAVQFAENLEKIWGVHETMTAKKLTDKQMIALAMRAAEIRWNKTFTKAEAAKLLSTKRTDDEGNDAWRVFNVLQENTINGGVQLEGMKRVPKPVNVPRDHYRINVELFDAAFEIATVGKLSPRKLQLTETDAN